MSGVSLSANAGNPPASPLSAVAARVEGGRLRQFNGMPDRGRKTIEVGKSSLKRQSCVQGDV